MFATMVDRTELRFLLVVDQHLVKNIGQLTQSSLTQILSIKVILDIILENELLFICETTPKLVYC